MSKIINGSARVSEESQTGDIQQKPKGKFKIGKIIRTIFEGSDDMGAIADYLLDDVLLPALKKALSEAGRGAWDKLIYRDHKPSSTTKVEPIGYSGIFERKSGSSSQARGTAKPRFGTLTLDNIDDCKMLLANMQAIIDRNGTVSVLQLYDMAGQNTDVYTAQKYGWANIDTARIIKTDDGWRLDMPIPMLFGD